MAELYLPTRLQHVVVIAFLLLLWVYWVLVDQVMLTTADALYYAFQLSALFLLASTVLLTTLNTVLPLNGVPDE
jgi:hypothetical protein